ncbi:hypothetical protein G6O69_06570 [Pseudenhygromyxa sp. WMMC2535]|uniref:hypothetical protein n=1 Tax=Pseudenhygromyxa sp. WMMC2535 TaxID=2712867 RepID=UPI001555B667|nr:hypothetical protein [Pseudenhygromyxa sp. WMMC2535]NVB37489.1 hypothetical protein [Pseudenhygromyxa sp. WMMC2535]
MPNARSLRLLPTTLALTALFALTGLGACAGGEELDSEDPLLRAAEDVQGVSYELSTAAALSDADIQGIVDFVQAQAQDVQRAAVQVQRVAADADADADADELTTLSIELWAAELPGEGLEAALSQQFAVLDGAALSVVELGMGPAPDPVAGHGIEPGDSPEVIEQKIVDDLRAQGIEGEIVVTVTPTEDGHHEISVEVHDEQDLGAPE